MLAWQFVTLRWKKCQFLHKYDRENETCSQLRVWAVLFVSDGVSFHKQVISRNSLCIWQMTLHARRLHLLYWQYNCGCHQMWQPLSLNCQWQQTYPPLGHFQTRSQRSKMRARLFKTMLINRMLQRGRWRNVGLYRHKFVSELTC